MQQLIQRLRRGLICIYEPGEDGIVRAPTITFRVTEEEVERCYELPGGSTAGKPQICQPKSIGMLVYKKGTP